MRLVCKSCGVVVTYVEGRAELVGRQGSPRVPGRAVTLLTSAVKATAGNEELVVYYLARF